ncbi:MAG: Programmed cell death antitoxin PemI [uncultured Paraburkholderia sp.]|nr:MAG: Programmed cell death antitoxin PemI [uncultured Paraburkholderia sp.]CAH2803800.1 MAG: Programmed cell death antitoxin PemI [uncultured Paraburkholderia sp.]CAH2933290.1 MAG: Programmed cell death antitoxin PemI [uncultured Paraburkholderia sp.]CAH2934493.1 MAG: Programmed cell death antitoxin PemI [uncultured Paraburkholderia sp.]
MKTPRFNAFDVPHGRLSRRSNVLHLLHIHGSAASGEETMVVTSKIRRQGGALVMTIPPALLKLLHVDAGDQMSLEVQDGQLIARPASSATKRYTLAELLEGSESIADLTAETAWARDGGPMGSELT